MKIFIVKTRPYADAPVHIVKADYFKTEYEVVFSFLGIKIRGARNGRLITRLYKGDVVTACFISTDELSIMEYDESQLTMIDLIRHGIPVNQDGDEGALRPLARLVREAVPLDVPDDDEDVID